MVFNRFFLKVLVRVVLILAALTALSMMFLRTDLLFTQIILGIILILQVWELTFFVNRTNQDLTRFIESVKTRDFTTSFNQSGDLRSFENLYKSFNDLIETFRALETESAAQYHFLTNLVDQIEFGIISFDKKGDITLINRQAQSLLEIPAITHWQQLQNPNFRFLQVLLDLPDARNQLVETKVGGQQRYFSVSITAITIREELFRIASFQDIRSEIQSKEIEAWHKLIRILTHEIMNSVTPMVSLTDTIRVILQDEKGTSKSVSDITSENIEDVNEALATIKDRSEGILKFVQNYRKLTKVPTPEFSEIAISELLGGVLNLMDSSIKERGIQVQVRESDAVISLDKTLISQVLINLLKNATEAMSPGEKSPWIRIEPEINEDYFKISVSDNGSGISEEKIEKVFVPFFTTKQNGSGIGLSLSRQIMNLHGGYLELTETSDAGTTFSLMFPIRLLRS